MSKIEWTEVTWNPVTGCNKVSPGCKYCYAETMSKRLKEMGQPKYQNEFKLTLHPQELEKPYKWRKPRVVFVNSMSDLFHERVSVNFILQIFQVMNDNPQHTFQVLTKRAVRLSRLSSKLNWTDNIWMGVSVESEDYLDRVYLLRETPAKIKFLSCEPLLGPLSDLILDGIDWVIVGGESGPKARPMQKEWVYEIKDKCSYYRVPFFFKQWGGKNKKKSGRLLDGKEYNETPDR